MINYAKDFFERLNFEKEDAEFLVNQLSLILNSAASDKWNSLVSDYENGIDKPFSAVLKEARECGDVAGVHNYTADLLIAVCMSRGAKKRFAEKGFGEEIFINSFLDLKYKLEECKLVKGIKGSFVAGWFGGWFNLSLLALGRLQFEKINFPYNYEKNGKTLKKGDKVISVHIPRTGTPFTPEECDKAFKMAAEIYSKEIDGDVVFFCGSWLMYPPLIEELDDRSNTKKFAKRFELIEVRDNAVGDHPDAWRLFDCDYNGDINSLDTSTGLRAAFVRMLKKKNVSGDGVGIFFYE